MSYPFRLTDATMDVLAQLLRTDVEHYAYVVSMATGRSRGSVATILAKLEHHGWVSSRWENSGVGTMRWRGPRRRLYVLRNERVSDVKNMIVSRHYG